jgi:hypothetical protein
MTGAQLISGSVVVVSSTRGILWGILVGGSGRFGGLAEYWSTYSVRIVLRWGRRRRDAGAHFIMRG